MPDSNGRMHPLAEYRGRPLVLNFWATWCEPCRREIPLLQALHQERGDSVQIVGVAVDFQADVLQYAQAQGITYPLLMGEKDGLAAVNALRAWTRCSRSRCSPMPRATSRGQGRRTACR